MVEEETEKNIPAGGRYGNIFLMTQVGGWAPHVDEVGTKE